MVGRDANGDIIRDGRDANGGIIRHTARPRQSRAVPFLASAVGVLAVAAAVLGVYATRVGSGEIPPGITPTTDTPITAVSTTPPLPTTVSLAPPPPRPDIPTAAVTTAAEPTTPAPRGGEGQLPAFKAAADLGANCQYPAGTQKASRAVIAPITGKVPTNPATVSASMFTDQGNIGLILNNAEAPCTVNNFASLAQKGFFNETLCHRLTTARSLGVLQCGDPTGTGGGGPGYTFANEYPTDQYPTGDPALQNPVIYPRGTLAMANAGPDTNGSQFFLVYEDSQLPPGYTVFGTVDATGLATLDKIAQVGVAGGSLDGKPATEVKVKSIFLD